MPEPDAALAMRAWYLLGGMDWAGIPLVAEILGYDDMELLITQLAHIRSHLNKQAR